jgi:hypothetical protein
MSGSRISSVDDLQRSLLPSTTPTRTWGQYFLSFFRRGTPALTPIILDEYTRNQVEEKLAVPSSTARPINAGPTPTRLDLKQEFETYKQSGGFPEKRGIVYPPTARPIKARPSPTRVDLKQDFETLRRLRGLPEAKGEDVIVYTEGDVNRMFINGHDYVTVNATASPRQRFAQLLMARWLNSIRPLHGYEYVIVAAAVLVAIGASSTFKDFGDRFVEGIEEIIGSKISSEALQDVIEWGIGIANLMTQSCLTATTFIHVVSLYIRGRSLPSHEYMKQLTRTEKFLLSMIAFTGFASFKMVVDTLYTKYKWPIGIGLTAGLLSYTSSTAINTNFGLNLMYTLKGDNNKLPAIRMLKQAKKEFEQAAAATENSDEFIHRLAKNNLLKQINRMNTLNTEDDQVEKIFTTLADDTTSAIFLEASINRFNWILILSITLGILASFVNVKAGLQVPNFVTFGWLPPEDNLPAFFANVSEADILSWISVILGIFVFGTPAGVINSTINSVSSENLIRTTKGFIPEFRKFGFRKFNRFERIAAGVGLVGCSGYAIGKAGASIKYPLINITPIPEISALVSLVVFLGLGMLSVKTFVMRARNRAQAQLLADALNAADTTVRGKLVTGIWSFYCSLSPEQQMTFRRLALNNIVTVIDSQISTLNMMKPGSEIFSDKLQEKLDNKFGDAANEVPELTTVIIEPPITSTDQLVATPASSSITGSPVSPARTLGTPSPTTRPVIYSNDGPSLFTLGYSGIYRNPGSPSPITMFGLHRNHSGSNLRQLPAVDMDHLNLEGKHDDESDIDDMSSSSSPLSPPSGGEFLASLRAPNSGRR